MRTLGYHRVISVENFRTPNFELVADILDWLVHRYDPTVVISTEISTENARIAFIKKMVETVCLRTQIRLNPRKIYAADGYAVKELLKLATMLHEAQKSVTMLPSQDTSFTLNSKLHDVKLTRQTCTQIVESGALLYELLGNEQSMRQDRETALRFLDGISRNLDSNSEHEFVERSVMALLNQQCDGLRDKRRLFEDLQKDDKNLEREIKKKTAELDRCVKRLQSLQNVRPAFMDEYEKHEQELEKYYMDYLDRYRNLDYLEHELDLLNKLEKDKMEENERALKRMQKRLREEEWRLLRGEQDADHDARDIKRPSNSRRTKSRQKNLGIYGSMEAPDDSEESVSDSDPEMISGSEDPAISLGGSVSSEDILEESEENSGSEGSMTMGMMSNGRFRGMSSMADDNF